ncbi:MAG: coniferyl aldehyde dehydrogenase [Steroidobacteraceae bacterium]|jgi:coniferyl-aldehyde dehydrogenase
MNEALMPEAPDMQRLLEAQQAAFRADVGADARVRRDRLERAIALLVDHQVEICQALADDFGRRPATLTRFVDILPAVSSLKFARRHVRRWMRPQRRRVGLPIGAPGVRAEIVPQPLGVVGLISPWNFPITLTFGPLAGILAAGNRCLIKPSEFTPAVSSLMATRVAKYFDPREVAVVTGGPEVAQAFSRLPFDHLMFTGSTSVGRRVMAAAAEHLVPVTLELGGKCPVLIGRSAPLARTVDRILLGKLTNSGQMCIAPDYLLLPEDMLEPFVREAAAWMDRAYPGSGSDPNYTSLVSEGHAERMRSLRADAAAKGARVISLGEGADGGVRDRWVAPALILGATDDMRVMQEEIFGPLLPVRTYREIGAAVAEVNARPKPLALYYFGEDRREMQWVLAHTVSGGATVNDVAVHFLAEELPFGGVGASGMGAYHGEHGFWRFSHARTVFRQTRLDVHGLVGLRPPYGPRAERILKWLIRR